MNKMLKRVWRKAITKARWKGMLRIIRIGKITVEFAIFLESLLI